MEELLSWKPQCVFPPPPLSWASGFVPWYPHSACRALAWDSCLCGLWPRLESQQERPTAPAIQPPSSLTQGVPEKALEIINPPVCFSSTPLASPKLWSQRRKKINGWEFKMVENSENKCLGWKCRRNAWGLQVQGLPSLCVWLSRWAEGQGSWWWQHFEGPCCGWGRGMFAVSIPAVE